MAKCDNLERLLGLSYNHVFRSDCLDSWIADLCTGEPYPLNESARDLLSTLLRQKQLSKTIPILKKEYNNEKLSARAKAFIYDLVSEGILTDIAPSESPYSVFETRGRVLRSLQLHVCGSCNQDCVFCYSRATHNSIPFDLLRHTIDHAIAKLGTYCFGLSGGEPLIHADTYAITDHLIANNCHCTIFTNGTVLDRSYFRRIRRTDRVSFSVSLHTLSQPVHESLTRTNTSVADVMRNIEFIADLGFPLRIGTVIANNHNDSLLDIIQLFHFIKGLKPLRYSYSLFVPMGMARERKNLQPSHEKAKEIHRAYSDVFGYSYGNNKETPSISKDDILRPCELGYGILSINEDGAITPCPSLQCIKLGNIKKSSLTEIWSNSKWLNKYRSLRYGDLESCLECSYLHICKGGCRGTAASLQNSITAPDIYSCYQVLEELKANDSG